MKPLRSARMRRIAGLRGAAGPGVGEPAGLGAAHHVRAGCPAGAEGGKEGARDGGTPPGWEKPVSEVLGYGRGKILKWPAWLVAAVSPVCPEERLSSSASALCPKRVGETSSVCSEL